MNESENIQQNVANQVKQIAEGEGQVGGSAPSQVVSVEEPVNPQPVRVQVPVPVKEESKFDPTMIFGILTLVVALFFLLPNLMNFSSNKTQASSGEYYSNIQEGPYQRNPKEYEPHRPGGHHDMSMKGYIDRKIAQLDKRIDDVDHRAWLIAVANNENAVISREIASSMGSEQAQMAQKYLIFNEEWKLNKMPEFINLTQDQRRLLLKSVDAYNSNNFDNGNNYENYRYRNYSNGYCWPSNNCQPDTGCEPYGMCKPVSGCRPVRRLFNWGCCN